jgi:hypothetical protein
VAAIKWLFIPSSTDLQTSWNSLSNAASGHWPLGPIVWGFSTASDLFNAFKNSASAAAGGCAGEGGEGPDVQVPGAPAGTTFHIAVIPNCPDSQTSSGIVTIRNVVHTATSLVFIIGFVLFLLRLCGIRIGGGGGEDDGGRM